MTMTKKKILLIAIISSALVLILLSADQSPKIVEQPKPKGASFSKNLEIEAKAVYVYDALNEKTIFERNSESQLALASLAKIMTAIVAKENIPEWQLIEVNTDAIKEEGDTGFISGEDWKIGDLLDAMLISSSNDAASAIALSRNNFISLMNEKSKELNLTQTFFLNSTGLDSNDFLAGAYGSAKDVGQSLNYLLKKHPSLLEATKYESLFINSRQFKNTNKIINEIPRIIAGKTGYSDLAGGNLALAVDVDFSHPVIIVVLGSSEQGRFSDAKTLHSEVLKYFSSQ